MLTTIIYLDFPQLPTDIKSVVDIEYLSDLIHRKKKLWESHKAMYAELELNDFNLVRNELKLDEVIDYLANSPIEWVVIHSSRFAVTNKDHFLTFLKKINFIDKDLAVFDFEDVKSFAKLSKKAALSVLRAIQQDIDNEVKILKDVFSKFEAFKLEDFYIEIGNYIDFISYLQSNFELRYFNAIEKQENIITKKSTDKAKLKREFDYHQFLPEDISIFFIRPFSFEEHEHFSQYKMQRLNIPDLALQWIHYSIGDKEFKVLLNKLFNYVKSRPEIEVTPQECGQNATELYINKLKERVSKLKTTEVYTKVEHIIKISTNYPSIDEIFDNYLKVYHRLQGKTKNSTKLVLGHGDFCFSNMLYDKRIDLLKLIDPKGGSTKSDVYMDEYYDLAKLSHSVLGNYDFINNGLFELDFDSDLILSLKIDNLTLLKQKQAAFKAILQQYGFNYELVRLYEASLFLSMLPLHIDNQKKIVAFILTAIQILKELDNA